MTHDVGSRRIGERCNMDTRHPGVLTIHCDTRRDPKNPPFGPKPTILSGIYPDD
jgi:hypothetical protein